MAESLTFSVGANTQNFQSGIDGMLGKLAGLVAAFVSAQAVIEAFGAAIDMGGRLHDLSTRTGETAGNLAILERAFDNTSVGAEKLGPAISKMQVGITALANDSEACKNAFTQLGLTFADLEDKSPTEQLRIIGERLAEIEDPTLRSATAVAIFGRSGSELLPVLTNFAKETAEAKQQLGSLPGMLDNTAATVDAVGDSLNAIKNKTAELAYGFLSVVVPAVEKFTSKLAGVDAAAIGAGLATALSGAFNNPMMALEILVKSISVGIGNWGNILISSADYFGRLMSAAFEGMGISIPAIGNSLVNMAAAFGQILLEAIKDPIGALKDAAFFLGPLFGTAGTLMAAALGEVMADLENSDSKLRQLAMTAMNEASNLGNLVVKSFSTAYDQTQFIYRDIFNTAEKTREIWSLWSSMTGNKDGFSLLSDAPTLGDDDSNLSPMDQMILDMAEQQSSGTVKQNSVLGGGGGGGGGGMTDKQIQQAITNALNNIAGINPNQAIGQSASAQRSKELKDQLQDLVDLGKGDTAKADAIRQSIATHESIALGTNLTATDRDAAWDWAKANMNADWADGLSVDKLADMAEQNILDGKTQAIRDRQQQEKDKQDEQTKDGGGAKDQQKPVSTLSIQQQLLALMQKIEPRIPVANLA